MGDEKQMRLIEKQILKKNKDILKWGIKLKMVDLKENKSFSCMSAYYKFTFNDKITMIWFKEDLNSNSPLALMNIGNYFDRIREQIIKIIFNSNTKESSDIKTNDVMTITGLDMGNDEPIGKIAEKMYSTLGLETIHGDRKSDIDYVVLMISKINDILGKRFEQISSQHLDYPGIDKTSWDIFD